MPRSCRPDEADADALRAAGPGLRLPHLRHVRLLQRRRPRRGEGARDLDSGRRAHRGHCAWHSNRRTRARHARARHHARGQRSGSARRRRLPRAASSATEHRRRPARGGGVRGVLGGKAVALLRSIQRARLTAEREVDRPRAHGCRRASRARYAATFLTRRVRLSAGICVLSIAGSSVPHTAIAAR